VVYPVVDSLVAWIHNSVLERTLFVAARPLVESHHSLIEEHTALVAVAHIAVEVAEQAA
jgi:hypothetical protein